MANGSATFRLDKSNIKLGLGFTAAAMVLGVLALLNVPPHFACWLSFGGLCFIFSLMVFIPCMVVRVRIDHRGIEYRGIKKTYIRWQDARQVYIIGKRRCAKIYGNGKRMTAGCSLEGFSQMIKLIEQYAQVEIGYDAAFKQKGINDVTGKTIRKSKSSAVFGFFMLILPIALVLFNYIPENPLELLVIPGGAVLGLYFIQGYYFDKVYIDSHRIVRSSLFAGKVEIRWEDIKSVALGFKNNNHTLTILSNNRVKIIVTSEFKQFDDIEQFVKEYSPVKAKNDDDE